MKIKINQNILKKYFHIDALNGSIKDRLKNHRKFGSEGSLYIHMEDKDRSFGCSVRTSIDIYYEDPNDALIKLLMPRLREVLNIDKTTEVTIHSFVIDFLNGPNKIKMKCTLHAKGIPSYSEERSILWTDEFRSVLSKILTEHGIEIQI
jgi:hypothetical protein